jgi:hypothetical protein
MDRRAVAQRAEQLAQDPLPLHFGFRRRGIELLRERGSVQRFARELRVVGDVEIAGEHPLAIRAAIRLEPGIGHGRAVCLGCAGSTVSQ